MRDKMRDKMKEKMRDKTRSKTMDTHYLAGSWRMAKLDFLLMKTQQISYLSLVIVLLMFAMMGSSVVLLGINGAWFMALMSINVFAVQEKNNLDRLYGSLSMRWKDIILGRYLSIFMSYIASFLMVIAVYGVFSLIKNSAILFSDILLGFSLSFMVFSAIISFEIPMLFHMGYTKARAWALLPYIIVVALIFAPYYVAIFFSTHSFPSLATVLPTITGNSNMLAAPRSVLIIGGLAAACGIQYLSYLTTVTVYRRKRRGSMMHM